MEQEIISHSATQLFNYGVLGVFCVLLIVALIFLWKRMEKREEVHGKRIEEFTQVVKTFGEQEVLQTEVLRDLKSVMQQVAFNQNANG